MLISAVIAEDHDVTRQGLNSLLTQELDARVAATTGDGLEVLPLVKEHSPDLVVLDLGLPHLNGLDILRQIQSLDRPIKVVILSMHEEEAYVGEALQLGAAGYVLKGSPLSELTNAIQAAMEGRTYLSSDLSEDLLSPTPSTDEETVDPYQNLTSREREILQLTAEGYTSREIGEKLSISHRTVEKHRENVQSKLELRNTVEMATYAHERGLIQSPHSGD